MLKRIFDIENDRVVITPNVLLIPEFKALVEKYEDPIPALSFVYFMTSPESPYSDVPEIDKEEVISGDVGGDFKFEDQELKDALEKSRILYATPTRTFFLNAKKGLEKLGKYLADTEITEGLHGNFSAYQMAYTRIGKVIQEFKVLEKEHNQEVSAGLRGSGEASYDE